jgi:hypothetical protein
MASYLNYADRLRYEKSKAKRLKAKYPLLAFWDSVRDWSFLLGLILLLGAAAYFLPSVRVPEDQLAVWFC